MSEDERKELILDIADYLILTESSTRKTAQKFGVSNYTISDYMNNRLPKIDKTKYELVQEILKGNKPKTVDDKDVIERINKAVELLKSGFTVVEIAKALGSTEMIIYRDLTVRLKCISKEEYEKVKVILSMNSINNLVNQGINSKK